MSLKEQYGTIRDMLAAYQDEIIKGAAHKGAVAEMRSRKSKPSVSDRPGTVDAGPVEAMRNQGA